MYYDGDVVIVGDLMPLFKCAATNEFIMTEGASAPLNAGFMAFKSVIGGRRRLFPHRPKRHPRFRLAQSSLPTSIFLLGQPFDSRLTRFSRSV